MINAAFVKKILAADLDRYKEYLLEAVRSENGYLQLINKYVLENAGKEIRPKLSLLGGRVCGALTEVSYAVAAVSQMIHTATLMHDDVADQAKLRRNAPTISAMFTPAAAVLAGDYWLSRALQILTDNCDRRIVGCFTKAVRRMAEGELLQMSKADSLDTSEEDYNTIIYGKTAALFVATMKSAATAAGASDTALVAIEQYAENVGLAFQIRDDIFDYSPVLNTGKEAGCDLKERKITLPLLKALQNAPKEEAVKIRASVAFEAQIPDIVAFVHKFKGIEQAQKQSEAHIQKACRALSVFPQSAEKECLMGFAEYINRRTV